MKAVKLLTVVLIGALMCSLHSCEKEKPYYGRITVLITDDPFPIDLIEEASIRVVKLEAHPIDSDEDENMILLSEDTVKYNLIDLRNGVVEELIDSEIEAGSYDYFRLYVDEAGLTLIDGESYSVKVPSGSTSGIKIKVDPPVTVEQGLTEELMLDIDLGASFVLNGNYLTPAGIHGFNFKPVIRAINIADAGRIEGIIKDEESKLLNGVSVMMEYESNTYTTFSDSAGFYTIISLPTGIYKMTAEKEGYQKQILEDIVVVAGNKTSRNLTMLR